MKKNNIIREGLIANELLLLNQFTGEIAFSFEAAIESTQSLLRQFPYENPVKMCQWRLCHSHSHGGSPTSILYRYIPKLGGFCKLISLNF